MKLLRYFSEFLSIEEKRYRIEIYVEGATEQTELTLSNTPIVVDYNSDGVYSPLKLSGCTINVITDSPLIDLYTGYNQGVEVKLINITDNILEWFGYMTPNNYSSDYNSDLDIIALEAIDTLASLENIRYSLIGDKSTYRTFKELLLHTLDKADENKLIKKVYIQKTLRLSENATTNVWDDLLNNEENFFDELKEPLILKELLRHLCEYLGMTIIQYKDAFYIVDYAFLNERKGDFFLYDRLSGNQTNALLPVAQKDLYSDIGVYGSSCNISIGDVYNKASVIANLNNIENLIPELFDEDDLVNQNDDPDKMYEVPKTVDNTDYMILSKYLKSKNNWKTEWGMYFGDVPEELTPDNIDSIQYGSFFQSVDDYKVEDGEPASLNWDDFLTFANTPSGMIYVQRSSIELKKESLLIFRGGYFIINLDYKYSKSPYPNNFIKSNDEKYRNDKYTSYLYDTKFRCHLRIGDYYYNGEEWLLYSDYLDNIDYYNQTIGIEEDNGVRKWYIVNQDGNRTYISEQEYNKIDIKDNFWLVHKNKVGDPIFDTEKKLTNSVSYKYNLADGEEGALIPLPQHILNGDLHFIIYSPDRLGTTENYVTDVAISDRSVPYCHISDIRMIYTYKKTEINQASKNNILYSNEIDVSNVKEMDDVELYINTYAEGISSYSSVAIIKDGNYDFLDTLYSEIEGISDVEEHLLINKLCDHYGQTRYIYENDLKRKFDIFSLIYERTLDRKMIVDSVNIDYASESCRAKLTEI